MALIKVTAPDGEIREFDSRYCDKIRFGRNHDWADLVLDSELASIGVGREHCTLLIGPGSLTIDKNERNQTWVDGKVLLETEELPANCILSLTESDPETQFRVEFGFDDDLLPTRDVDGHVKSVLDNKKRANRNTIIGFLAITLLVVGVWFLNREVPFVLAESARNSIFSIQSFEGGKFSHVGTAWLTEGNNIVTNRHIAKRIESDLKLDLAYIRMPIKGPDGRGLLVKITDIEYHPAEAAFEAFLKSEPIRSYNENQLSLRAYDVAILQTAKLPEGLVPLELASEADMESLSTGAKLAIVGYPLKKGSTEWNIFMPDPEIALGPFDKSRGYAQQEGNRATNPFISYDIETTGGHSGSPVMNYDGQVVGIHFSGSNVIVGKQRMNSTGKSYGQSVRLVSMFVNGAISDDDTLQAETVIWKSWLRGLPSIEDNIVSRNDTAYSGRPNRCVSRYRGKWQDEDVNPLKKDSKGFDKRPHILPTSGHYSVFLQSFAMESCTVASMKVPGCFGALIEFPSSINKTVAGRRASISSGTAKLDQGSQHHFEYEFDYVKQHQEEVLKLTMDGPSGKGGYSINIYAWTDDKCEGGVFQSRTERSD